MDTPLEEVTHTDNIKLSDDGRSVVIIDQTLLPNRLEYIALTTREEMFEAIAMLRVRGAPAIGICAGYCAYCLALQAPHDSFDVKLHVFVGDIPAVAAQHQKNVGVGLYYLFEYGLSLGGIGSALFKVAVGDYYGVPAAVLPQYSVYPVYLVFTGPLVGEGYAYEYVVPAVC